MEIFSLSPLRAITIAIVIVGRAITIKRVIKKQITDIKKEAKKIKSDNFTGSIRPLNLIIGDSGVGKSSLLVR